MHVLKKRMPTFRCSAILFDLDGVLVDSTRSVEKQWRIWAPLTTFSYQLARAVRPMF